MYTLLKNDFIKIKAQICIKVAQNPDESTFVYVDSKGDFYTTADQLVIPTIEEIVTALEKSPGLRESATEYGLIENEEHEFRTYLNFM